MEIKSINQFNLDIHNFHQTISNSILDNSKWIKISEGKVIGIQFQIELTKISMTEGWSDQFLYQEMPKMAKKVTLQLTRMSFLRKCEVCFNQKRLPITYHNFRHKSLIRPKSKPPN